MMLLFSLCLNSILTISNCLQKTGHLTGCGGVDPHNSPTSASSASLGQIARKQLLTILRSKNCEGIDHFEEVIHPKQRPKDAFCS